MTSKAVNVLTANLPRLFDSALPALALAFDSKALDKAIGGDPSYAALQSVLKLVRIRLLSWNSKPEGACTCEIILGSGEKCRRLIGKAYLTDRPDIYEYTRQLQKAGFGPQAEFSIPQPVAYLPALHLLLLEKAEGRPAKEVFKYGDEGQRVEAAQRCAQWLAHFQKSAPLAGQVTDLVRLFERLERRRALLCREDEALAPKALQLLEKLKVAAESVTTIPMCAGHGDFGTYQILLGSDGRVVVYDWDLYDTAEPTRDVARFVISLERQARSLGTIHALDGAVQAFLETYLAAGGHPQVMGNLPFYKAAGYLRAASWKAMTKQPSSWCEMAEVMLDEGLKVLNQQAALRHES